VPTEGADRRQELAVIVDDIDRSLARAHQAREIGLAASRRVIRASGSSIRAVHRLDTDAAARFAGEAERALREAQGALARYPAVAFAGFLQDAEKEYAEARLTACIVAGAPIPDPEAVGVAPESWLKGLAEAASELRRHLLDRLRAGQLANADGLLEAMDDGYDTLLRVDYPDAVTNGLRRSVDGLRAVLERTRGDVTTTVLQSGLREALERNSERLPDS